MRLLAAASFVILLASPVALASSGGVADTVHVVAAGDTLWSIASRHGVTVEAVADTNRLESPDRLQVGLRLVLPGSSQVRFAAPSGSHIVRTGDTAWSIARMHGTTVDALARANGLTDPARLAVGKVLTVKGRTQAVRRAVPPPATPRGAIRPEARAGLTWPSRGVITSRFGFRGRRHHHGIDIAAPAGTAINAALDGAVTFAGWRAGYGKLVILDHGGGLTTWYGHASELLARVGRRVRQGELIARVGATGNVTGPNLHFEVRRGDTPLDPLPFLNGRR